MPGPRPSYSYVPRLMSPEEMRLQVDWTGLSAVVPGGSGVGARITDPAFLAPIIMRQLEEGWFVNRFWPGGAGKSWVIPPHTAGQVTNFFSESSVQHGLALLHRGLESLWNEQPVGVITTGVIVSLAAGSWMFGSDGTLQSMGRSMLFERLQEGISFPVAPDLSLTIQLDVADLPNRYSASFLFSGTF